MATDAAKAFARWLKPHEAVALLTKAFASEYTAIDTIKEWLRGGMLHAIAMTIVVESQGEQTGKDVTTIKATEWSKFRDLGWDSLFWKNGQITYSYRERSIGGDLPYTTRYFDVRFDPNDIQKIADIAPNQAPKPPPVPPAPLAQTARNKGGRPPKEFWDDLWIEIGRRIYMRELVPKRQADLERAMLDWVANQGYDVGETVVKGAAKKLFNAWKLGGR